MTDQYTNILISMLPILSPLLVAYLKNLLPRIPSGILPIICTAVGPALISALTIFGQNHWSNALLAAVASAAGVAVREVIKPYLPSQQAKQTQIKEALTRQLDWEESQGMGTTDEQHYKVFHNYGILRYDRTVVRAHTILPVKANASWEQMIGRVTSRPTDFGSSLPGNMTSVSPGTPVSDAVCRENINQPPRFEAGTPPSNH